LIEELLVIGIGKKLEDWCEVAGEKPGVDSRDKLKHTERVDLLFAEKTILVDKQV